MSVLNVVIIVLSIIVIVIATFYSVGFMVGLVQERCKKEFYKEIVMGKKTKSKEDWPFIDSYKKSAEKLINTRNSLYGKEAKRQKRLGLQS